MLSSTVRDTIANSVTTLTKFKNIYWHIAVHNATWKPVYDIRVDMQSKEKPVTLIYKASITQSTGEAWDDVPLTLETASPTFGVGVPVLIPWTLSIASNYYGMAKKSKSFNRGGAPGGAGEAPMMSSILGGPLPPPMARQREEASESEIDSIQHRGLQVSSKGAVSAAFGVPGLISIPSDGVGHIVTIVKLSLDAEMSWVCVPKKDTRVHLKVSHNKFISSFKNLLIILILGED